jgi:hypothetical protein
MNFRRIYGIIPVLVFYTDTLPDHVAGRSKGLFVLIKPRYREDEGLIQHELEHVRQFYRPIGAALLAGAMLSIIYPLLALPIMYAAALTGMLFHVLAYKLIDAYKLRCEATAYWIQSRYYSDNRLPLFARFISANYGLDISQAGALNALLKAEKSWRV